MLWCVVWDRSLQTALLWIALVKSPWDADSDGSMDTAAFDCEAIVVGLIDFGKDVGN